MRHEARWHSFVRRALCCTSLFMHDLAAQARQLCCRLPAGAAVEQPTDQPSWHGPRSCSVHGSEDVVHFSLARPSISLADCGAGEGPVGWFTALACPAEESSRPRITC